MGHNLLLGCCYRPPASSINSVDHLLLDIESALSLKKNVVVCGDFNINLLGGIHPLKDKMCTFVDDHSLCQPIASPTRISCTTQTLIDIFLLSSSDLLMSSGVSDLAISDHQMVYVNLTLAFPKPKTISVRKRSYRKFNEEEFCADLVKAPWCLMDIFECPDDKLFVFEQLINSCLDEHAPLSNIKRRKHKLPWITPTVQKAIDNRNRLLRKFKKTSCPEIWKSYKKCRNTVTRVLRDSKKVYFEHMIEKSVSPNMLWKCIKSTLPASSESWDVFERSHTSLADAFNHHFVSITKGSGSSSCRSTTNSTVCVSPSISVPCCSSSQFELHTVSVDDCTEVLNALKPNRSCGPDSIPSFVLKSASNIVAPHLTTIINISLASGSFPNSWKLADVKPLHKSGDKDQLTNYRPISLLPSCSKVIEKIVRYQLTHHLESNNLIYPLQSGFRKHHSTATTLLRCMNEWFTAIDDGFFVGVVFLDLSKAFDSVDHLLLQDKLTTIGIAPSARRWFSSYLSNRSQRTIIGESKSLPLTSDTGVPQGSVLGPTLFSIMINDMPSACPDCTAVLFADDTTIYAIGKNVNEIACQLSTALARCQHWLSDNHLQLNLAKTKCMLIHSQHKAPPPLALKLSDTSIEQVSKFKFLGCVINHHLSWDDHIQLITTKVTRNINLLRNLSWFLPRSALLKFYEAYILPTFDYCDVVWFCCTRTQTLKLERLQNYAGRVIPKEPRISSATSIRKKLGWTTLETRRNTHMATHIFKTLKNAAPSYLQTLLQPRKTTGYHTRGAVCGNLLLPQPRTEAGKKAFSFSAPRLWNSLPDEAKGSTSLTLFTACVRSHFNTV